MKKYLFLSILSLTLLFFIAPVTVQAQRPTQTVKPKKFERLMKKENTVVLDVRTPEEFKAGHLPGAVNIDIKDTTFLQQIQMLDRDKKYLLYCRSGRRSQTALDLMQQNGFPHLLHLKGGIEAWKDPKE